MAITIKKSEGNLVEIRYTGDAHTILNLLKRKLLNNKEVSFVGYNKPHPLMKDSYLIVRTKKEDPKKVIKKEIDSIIKELKSIEIK